MPPLPRTEAPLVRDSAKGKHRVAAIAYCAHVRIGPSMQEQNTNNQLVDDWRFCVAPMLRLARVTAR